MKYKLSKEDYLRLWPMARPWEIEEEFGAERSRCKRQIYRFYRRYGLSAIEQSRKEMREKILAGSPMNITAMQINQELDRLIEEGKNTEFKRMWEKIDSYEDRWNAHC